MDFDDLSSDDLRNRLRSVPLRCHHLSGSSEPILDGDLGEGAEQHEDLVSDVLERLSDGGQPLVDAEP